jgi:protein involved in polysaccharide export with SLBB domain
VAANGELPVFGADLFRIATSQFQAVTTGPVDPDYRLGPGDQLVVVLTGDVELAYTLDVNREGVIAIPDVGQVVVAGLTLRELEDRLYERLGRVYSGVGRGSGASTQFSLSLGKLRSNQVFLIGEVQRPGAYQVSSVATVFDALYQGRGPSASGSFRRIEVRRGGQAIRTIDIYEYLLRGSSRDDIRLEQGDVIFIPLVGTQVGIRGAVRRQALFELKPGEGMRDLLGFAGGLQAQASVARIQIDRVLPPGQRRPGMDRVLVDVDVSALLSGRISPPLQDNDLISVFSIAAERRNRLMVTGVVRRPGLYEWSAGTTLWSVIDRAEGLPENAYTARAHIYRFNAEDGTRRLIRTSLYADAGGRRQDVALEDRDSVVIYDRAALGNPASVNIAGLVKAPGQYTLAEGMTIRDLVLAAGGFARGADETSAELARLEDPRRRSSRTAHVFEVPLLGTAGAAAPDGDGRGNRAPEWSPSASEMPLQDGDVVFVRKAPGFEAPRTVNIVGEVLRPGTYVLQTRQERLLDVMQRAGGLTPEAYARGVRLTRAGRPLATDFTRAVESPNSRFNVVLEPGDVLNVPQFDPTVLVTGAVQFEARVLYDPRYSLADYISRAGGYADNANRGRVSIIRADGERFAARGGRMWAQARRVTPGSQIFVPVESPDERTDWGDLITKSVSLITGAATLWIALSRL